MISAVLKDILLRAENWPAENQEELMRAALYIEQRHSGDFTLTSGDRKIMNERLEAAKLGALPADEEFDAVVGTLKDMRKETTLGSLSWKDLRNAGRK